MSQNQAGSDPLPVTVELGRTRIARRQLDGLAEGSLVTLDQRTEEPLEIFVDGELVAHGEKWSSMTSFVCGSSNSSPT